MKKLFPGRVELAVLTILAGVCATIASLEAGPQRDLWMAAMSMPLFFTACVMGLRRNWKLAEADDAVGSHHRDQQPGH